jgi:hypothetical protein
MRGAGLIEAAGLFLGEARRIEGELDATTDLAEFAGGLERKVVVNG